MCIHNKLNTIMKNNKYQYNKGNTLAEFAVVTALMATLAATASPKLSELSENGKKEKSINEIGKIVSQGQQFYQDAADTEGRGRFPGQGRYDMTVGGVTHATRGVNSNNHSTELADAELDIFGVYNSSNDTWSGGDFNHFEHSNASGWLSVFGLTSDVNLPDNHNLHADDNVDIESENVNECKNCQGTVYTGHEEWQIAFGGEVLNSPFQDGHFIYRVIPGYGSGSNSIAPILFVADLENPAELNAVLIP